MPVTATLSRLQLPVEETHLLCDIVGLLQTASPLMIIPISLFLTLARIATRLATRDF
jgi:hypothetical protein